MKKYSPEDWPFPGIEPYQVRDETMGSRWSLAPEARYILWGTAGVLCLLMLVFRIPPLLLLRGAFQVLRLLFLPLVLAGLVYFSWRWRK